jgi:hypothetical protein
MNIAHTNGSGPVLELFGPLFEFTVATLLVAIAFGATYLAGLVQSIGASKKLFGFWFFNLAAILLVIASYVVFFVGSLHVYFACIEAFKK